MSERINVRLGPVVGKVETDVRILLECDNKSSIQITITLYAGFAIQTKTVNLVPGPNLLIIDLLDHNSPHSIVFENVWSMNKKTICTFDPIINGTCIISCDGDGVYHYNTGNKKTAWDLASSKSATHAIHIGDQVYIDDAYANGMKRVTKQTTDTEIIAMFESEIRNIYYNSWFLCLEKQNFLATHVNTMIVDDHDIYDNFTSTDFLKKVYTKPKMKLFLDVASRIAGEYQISLTQSVKVETFEQLKDITKVTILEDKNIKFIIINSRVSKTQTGMFDSNTKQLICNNITGIFRKKLVVVDQVSPFLLSHKFMQVKLFFTLCGIDITDHVTYRDCWIRDYNWLFGTMCSSDAKKIVYVTGDLHVGQEHVLFRNIDGKEIKCLTSSPMSSNVGLPKNYIMDKLIKTCSQQYTGFNYKNNLIHKNNFVVVTDDTDHLYTMKKNM